MNATLLQRTRGAWEQLAPLRQRRLACKRAAFATSTRVEGISNNLIRQLIKSITGRYMHIRVGAGAVTNPDPLLALDVRALEEFLISGMAMQRIGVRGEVVNFSPARVAFEPFECADAADCTFLAMLHDINPGEAVRRFSGGDPKRIKRLMELFEKERFAPSAPPGGEKEECFDTSAKAGCIRVAEIWHKTEVAVLHCHDRQHGEYGMVEWSDSNLRALDALNERRRKKGEPEIGITASAATLWHEEWIDTSGVTLGRRVHSGNSEPPLVMRLYPFIDGEVHSLVADVMPQQQLVDRMVMLLDEVVANSAKGVLLYPADQLPEGLTWRDMRRIWRDPGGVIPYRRTSRTAMPRQISTPGWAAGAADMLRLQLDLFDQVAGVSGSLRGKEGAVARGADALAAQTENATVGMYDLLASFGSFINQRNRRINLTTTYES